MEEKTQITPYPLRIPPEMREKLESAAKAGNRSLHAEIMMRLEKSLSSQTISPLSIDPSMMESVDQMHKTIQEQFEMIREKLAPIEQIQQRLKTAQNASQFARENAALIDAEIEKSPDDTPIDEIIERVKNQQATKQPQHPKKPPKT